MKRDNRQKVLGRSALNYTETHRKFATYLSNSADDLAAKRAHIEFLQRGKRTRAVLRARLPGEGCKDHDEGVSWLFNISTALKRRQPCGKLSIQPNGDTTEISIEK